MTRGGRIGDVVVLPGDNTVPAETGAAGGVARVIAKSLDSLRESQGSQSTHRLSLVAGPSSSPTILEFSTRRSATCLSGRNFALLYLALQRMTVPIGITTKGMDAERREWWLRVMAEHIINQWGITAQGVKAIAAAQPLVWEQPKAGTTAWKKAQREQQARFFRAE